LGQAWSGSPLDFLPIVGNNVGVHKMFQYRIYPTKKQLHKLNETLEECRWLYNHLLAHRKEAYEQRGASLTCYGQIDTFPSLAKSIADASWSEFFSKLSGKAEEAGRQFIKVNPAYTSQDCSGCHHRQKVPLSERTYHCPCCLLSIDRDLNASMNILRVGLHTLGTQPVEAPAFTRGE